MTETQNEEERREIKRTFDMFDEDKDGKITTADLGAVLKGLGHECTAEELKEFIAAADSDGSGTIDIDEFTKMVLLDVESTREEDEIVAAFRIFDRENNGYISSAELKHTMKVLQTGLSDSEIQAMIVEADSNGDGVISYEEFAKMIVPKRKAVQTTMA